LSLPSSSIALPISVGFLTFDPVSFAEGIIPLLLVHKPIAVWLFAPASRDQHTKIITALKAAGEQLGLKVFVQVGSVQTAKEAVEDGCDILVVQGTDARGHQSARGAGLITLVSEISDMLADEYKSSDIRIVAAGGVMDGRGIAATLALGICIPLTEVLTPANNSSRSRRRGNGNESKSGLFNVVVRN
jgi:nitronate monooxygenase